MIKKILIYLISIFFYQSLLLAENKIYFIDVNYIYNNSIVGKKYNQEIKKKQDIFKKNFDERQNLIKKDQDLLISQKNILAEEEFKKKAESLNKKIEEVKININKDRNLLEKFSNDVKAAFYNELLKIMFKYSEENSIEMIINKENILLGKNELDISDNILTIIDKDLTKLKLE